MSTTAPDAPVSVPRVTVAAIIEQSGKFLFVEEQVQGQGLVVNQPAGHLELNESLLGAVRREVLEETAHDFSPQGLVGVYHYHTASVSYVRFCFHGESDRHYPDRALDAEIERTLWLDRETLREQRLRTPMVERCLDDYLAGRRWPLDILHHEPECP